MEGDGLVGTNNWYQIVICDIGVSLHSKTPPLFMKYNTAQYYAYQYLSLFSVLFYNPYMSLFNSCTQHCHWVVVNTHTYVPCARN